MPNRILKESICTSDTIDQLKDREEVFFYRLIVNCDDYGRFDARPKILKAKLFPLKNMRESEIEEILSRMQLAGIVRVYECDGRPYLQLANWERHQTIRNHKSKYPSEDECIEKQIEINCNQLHADVPVIQSNPNPTISCPPEAGQESDPEGDFKKIYDIYPKKVGKAKAYSLYLGWLKGRVMDGKKIKLNNKQMYLAVKGYVRIQEENGIELQFYKNFDTFMNKQILDFVGEGEI